MVADRARRKSGVVHVGQYLIVRVRMDRRHDAGGNSNFLVQHLGDRRKAIRRARRIRNDRMVLLQHVVIDAIHDRGIDVVAARSRNHHLLRAALQWAPALALEVNNRCTPARTRPELAPGQLRRITLGENAMRSPLTIIESPSTATSPGNLPCTVS